MLGEILKSLRDEKKLTQNELGKIVGITGRNISYYENGERIPPVDVLIKFANYFNVTTDYLLDRTWRRSINYSSNDIASIANDDKKIYEIIKAIYKNPKLVEVLEFTISLNEQEVKKLIKVMKALKDD